MVYVVWRSSMTGGRLRTTLVLDEIVVRRLKQRSEGNISELANRILKDSLFPRGESMFGALKGLVSTEDIDEEEVHEELRR